MKFFIAFAVLVFGLQSFAANRAAYDLKMNLKIGKEKPAKIRIVTLANEMASVIRGKKGDQHFVEVIATEDSRSGKGLRMDFVVGRIKADGSREILMRPQIIGNFGEEASIRVSGEKSKEPIELKVTPTRSVTR